MKRLITLTAALLAAACAFAESDVPQSATLIQPLEIKQFIPETTLRTREGEPFELLPALKEGPAVLIFYRGGWCPYCTRHLGELQQAEEELIALGYQILAISPDRPEKLAVTAENGSLRYTLLSDSTMEASRAFSLAFQVNDATVKMYKEKYQIDIEADSGQTHHQLPVPAVFVVDPNGQIIFSYVNADYKTRLDPQALVGAVQLLALRPEMP